MGFQEGWEGAGCSEQVVPPATATATQLPLNCQAGNEEKGEESCQSPEKYQFLNSFKGWTAICQIRVIWAEFILFYTETFYNLEAVEDLGAFHSRLR